MPVILGANSASGGYNITNSLRFEKGSSDYLSRTPSGSGSTTTWTYSLWVKRSVLNVNSGNENCLFTTLVSGSSYNYISFSNTTASTSDRLLIRQYSGGNVWIKESTQQFRDTSGWYHLVFVYDSSNATASDRVRMYVNGSRITSFAQDTNPTQNTASYFNTAVEHRIGQESNYTNNFFNGYMSEIYFINAQALDPTSFGETDEDTGIWKPKAYTGTYGTNGFYLQFKNSSSLGTDSSGNGNTFTVNNLTSIDQTTDTPTNNFANLISNFGVRATTETYSEGNLKVVGSGNAFEFSPSSIAPSAGKWYFEAKMESKTNYPTIGFQETSQARTNNFWMVSTSQGYGLHHDGTLYRNNASEGSLTGYTTGDIMAVALDLDNGKAYFRKNGTWLGSADPANGTNPAFSSIPAGTYYLGVSNYNSTWGANFGNPYYSANSYTDSAGFGNFSYSVPSGYFALCTANLSLYG